MFLGPVPFSDFLAICVDPKRSDYFSKLIPFPDNNLDSTSKPQIGRAHV